MKIVGMSASMNHHSESRRVIEKTKALLENDHDFDIYYLEDYKQSLGCTGCFECRETNKCVNEMNHVLVKALENAEVIFLSTPIYFGNVSGLLKLFIDTTYCMNKERARGKKVVLLSAAEKAGQEGLAVSTILPWVAKNEMLFIGSFNSSNETVEQDLEAFIMQIESLFFEALSPSYDFAEMNVLGKTFGYLKKYELHN